MSRIIDPNKPQQTVGSKMAQMEIAINALTESLISLSNLLQLSLEMQRKLAEYSKEDFQTLFNETRTEMIKAAQSAQKAADEVEANEERLPDSKL